MSELQAEILEEIEGFSKLKEQLADADAQLDKSMIEVQRLNERLMERRRQSEGVTELQMQSEGDQYASEVRIAMYTQKRTFD